MAAAALVAAPALSAAPVTSARAADAVCAVARGFYPNVQGAPILRSDETDVNTYVGGDFTAKSGASEAEGKVVGGGDATFDTNAHFNLGVAGVGSQVTPPASSDMLVSGGDVLAASSVLEVGHGIGGNIVGHGSVGPLAKIDTNGGSISDGVADPLLPYVALATGYQQLSTAYANMTPTGSTVVTGWDITFTGDGSTSRQVFTLNSSDLGSGTASSRSIVFADIPLDTIVVVNVIGASATLWTNSFWDKTTQILHDTKTDTIFSQRTQALLWNFVTATSVILGDGDQLPGSVLVPAAGSTTKILTSLNGRFYTAGDVEFGGSTQSGLELHNYAFREEMCAAVTTGSLSITKTLTDVDSVVAGNRVYTGTYVCTAPSVGVVARGVWSLTVGGAAFVTPLVPAGSTCTVAEDALLTAPSATDPSYLWMTPVINSVSTVIPNSPTPAVVTVHNQVRRALGGLEMVKVLDDPYDVVDLTRFYSGTFSCVFKDGRAPLVGTWREQAGAPPVLLASGIPVGTVCTLTEDPILVPPLPGFPQYHWATPVISPATVTVVENTVARFTVTNIVVDPIDPPTTPAARESLPITGASAYGPLAVAAVMLLLGLIGLLIKNRQRRSNRDG